MSSALSPEAAAAAVVAAMATLRSKDEAVAVREEYARDAKGDADAAALALSRAIDTLTRAGDCAAAARALPPQRKRHLVEAVYVATRYRRRDYGARLDDHEKSERDFKRMCGIDSDPDASDDEVEECLATTSSDSDSSSEKSSVDDEEEDEDETSDEE
jgi:hypothetical protein